MYPKTIEKYFAPTEVREALDLLQEHRPSAKLLAGGQSLMPLMKLRLVEPRTVIDLNRVAGLSELRQLGGTVQIGALSRHAEIAVHPLVVRAFPILVDAARNIGDPQIRNRGTLAGSLVHADPAADYPPALMALDARVVMARANDNERIVGVDEFLIGPLMSDIAEDELLTAVVIPSPPPASGGAYMKHSQVAGDFAVISVAVQLTLDPAGICQRASIVVGGVMPRPARAPRAAAELEGHALTANALSQAGELAAQEVETSDDVRASAEYRSQLIRTTVPTMVRRAAQRAEERRA
jgi:CO/xanthine dehydrogenase FAD-binding subunit